MGFQRNRLSDTEQSDEADLPKELRDVLSDPHGRNAVVYLARRDEPVGIAELSRGVVGLLDDTPNDAVGDDVARRVQTWLHHGHLPTLERHGVVEYHPDEGTVELVADWTPPPRRRPGLSESQ